MARAASGGATGQDDVQHNFLASLHRRAAAGQVDRRGFLRLAAAIGIEQTFAATLADQALAAPALQGQGGRSIATSYDYIVIGAGSAGCTIAARLSEDAACRVLLIEAGGGDISRSALQNPVLWPSNFGTDVDWAYRTTPQARAAGRVIVWPRGKVIGGSSSINAMIWVWGHAADFDRWAEAGNRGWDYAHLKPLFQSIESCAQANGNRDRGTSSPMHVEPLADPNPLSVGFFRACQELGHQIAHDVGAPVRDGAGYVDFNTRDGRPLQRCPWLPSFGAGETEPDTAYGGTGRGALVQRSALYRHIERRSSWPNRRCSSRHELAVTGSGLGRVKTRKQGP
jgi:GMC oxidoreductase